MYSAIRGSHILTRAQQSWLVACQSQSEKSGVTSTSESVINIHSHIFFGGPYRAKESSSQNFSFISPVISGSKPEQ
jgi:hypothetical protein